MCLYLVGAGGEEGGAGAAAGGTAIAGWRFFFFFFFRFLLARAIPIEGPPWPCVCTRQVCRATLGLPSADGRCSVRFDRPPLRNRHRTRGEGQGELLLHLVPDRDRGAALRPDRGDPLPLGAHRARAALPDLQQHREAARPGLPALRDGPVSAGSGGGTARTGASVATNYLSQVRTIAFAKPMPYRITAGFFECPWVRLATVTGTSLAGTPRLIASIRNSEVWNCSWRRTS